MFLGTGSLHLCYYLAVRSELCLKPAQGGLHGGNLMLAVSCWQLPVRGYLAVLLHVARFIRFDARPHVTGMLLQGSRIVAGLHVTTSNRAQPW